MGGLFGGNKETPAAPQPVTLPAPTATTPQEKNNQGAAQADALKRAQTASTLATAAPGNGQDDGTYSSTTLGG